MKFTGTPIAGRGRGRTIGFPTINLHNLTWVDIHEGVYAAKATVRGKQYKAAMHCGAAPTFKNAEHMVEIFLLDTPAITVSESETITVEIISYLRPVMKFENKDDLIEQIKKDVAKTATLVPLA